MVYKLYGIIDGISGKKITIGGHNDSIEKLLKLIPDNGKHPILDGNKFYGHYNMNIDDLVGEKVAVWAYVKKYNFASTFEHNRGVIIKGWNLVITRIEKNTDWS